MFSHLFDRGLEVDHARGHCGILDLRTDGVDFARHLLKEKIHALSDGFGGIVDQLAHLGLVAFQADELLGDVASIGQDGDFLLESGRLELDVDVLEEGVEAIAKTGSASLQDSRAS